MKKNFGVDGSNKGNKIDHSGEDPSGWNDIGGYMRAKVRKLDAQFKEDNPVSENSSSTKIFENVVIHVNGYTVPPVDELRRLVYKHGGRYQQYYTKSTVTHIIATNLPDCKIKQLRDEKVVRPEWIVDSVKTEKLLPVKDYLLYQRHKSAQALLSKTHSGSVNTIGYKPPEAVETRQTEIKGLEEGNMELPFKAPQLAASSNADVAESSKIIETTVCEEGKLELSFEATPVDDVTNIDSDSIERDETIGNKEWGKDLPLEAVHADTLKNSDNEHFAAKAGDANFVSEFYKNSRLHFLSTWGAEFKEFTSKLIKSRVAQGQTRTQPSSVPNPYGRVIMHIDMDSFFVSVTLRDKPHLRGKPIAVCHAGKGNPTEMEGGKAAKRLSPDKLASFLNSMSEIASCSYEARDSGVRNGMFLGKARQLCPSIICVPYEFQKYRQVSQRLYEILVSYTHEIEAVSCDEAYIDVSNSLDENTSPTDLAQKIRGDIYEATGCTASAGISFNVLLARMCTKKAKPNGQFYLSRSDNVQEFMGLQSVRDLPGVGWALNEKLQSLNIRTCGELQKLSLQALQREFGPKSGTSLYQACRGVDDRPLKTEHKRKSVSAEINYGIRFTKDSEADKFIEELSLEVHKRLKAVDMKGKCVTLKLKVRKAGAPMPSKFMGHGICDNVARSCMLPMATDESAVFSRECVTLLRDLKVRAEDMRGMGIQVSKLSPSSECSGSRTLLDFIKLHKGTTQPLRESHQEEAMRIAERGEGPANRVSPSSVQAIENVQVTPRDSGLPPLPRFSPPMTSFQAVQCVRPDDGLPSPSQVDPTVLAALPEDIRRSIERSYAARNQHLPVFKTKTPEHRSRVPVYTPLAAKTVTRTREESLFTESLPTPSRIDPDFLDALPDDVRQEVEQTYRLRIPEEKRQGEATNGRKNSARRGEFEELTFSEKKDDTKSRSRAVEVSLGGAVSFPDVKKVLKEWTLQCEVPLKEDMEEVRDYLLKLIDDNNLEQVSSVLKFLSRAIRGLEEEESWRSAYGVLISCVQESMIKRYGCRLVV